MMVGDLQSAVDAAVGLDGIESAAIYVVERGSPGPPTLRLGAAAGIAGPALERLSEAVVNPEHPIARTSVDGLAAFDVLPTAPGGPALRSHLPITARSDIRILGVLAVAHDRSLDAQTREALDLLATSAASAIRAP
jgi:hypothetical protein